MNKVLGTAILMISIILFGLSYYKKYKVRPQSLEMYIELLSCYLLELKWKRKSFTEVVKQNSTSNKYLAEFAALLNFHSLTESAMLFNKEFENLFLTKSDIEIIKNFITNTGKSNLGAEIILCNKTIELLNINKEEAINSMKKTGPLSLKISIILGFAIAIVLL